MRYLQKRRCAIPTVNDAGKVPEKCRESAGECREVPGSAGEVPGKCRESAGRVPRSAGESADHTPSNSNQHIYPDFE